MFAPWSFSPLVLSPAAWFDASDASTLWDSTSGGALVAANGSVVRWEDKSGNGRHFTQSTGVSQPTRRTAVQNGRDVVRFDGANDFMDTAVFTTMPQPFSIFCAYQCSRTTVGDIVISVKSGVSLSIMTNHRAAASAVSGMNMGTLYAPLATVTTPQVLYTCANGSSSKVARNGGSLNTGNAGAETMDTIRVGGSQTLGTVTQADVMEIIALPYEPTEAQRAAIDTYLINKWGITP